MSKYKSGDYVLLEGKLDKEYKEHYQICINGQYVLVEKDCVYNNFKTYEQGLQDAWELARKIGGMTRQAWYEIFKIEDAYFVDILDDNTYQQALAKLEAYEKSQQIQVGDVVYAQGIKGVVIDGCTEDSDNICYVFCENGNVEDWKFIDLKKTGRHIDIEHLLEQIRGDQ